LLLSIYGLEIHRDQYTLNHYPRGSEVLVKYLTTTFSLSTFFPTYFSYSAKRGYQSFFFPADCILNDGIFKAQVSNTNETTLSYGHFSVNIDYSY
jgi:hypothetical protein